MAYLHQIINLQAMSAVIPRLRDNYKRSDRRKEKQKLYNDTYYKKIRDWYMQAHCLCEECLKDNLITQAVHCHHIQSPFQIGISKQESYRRLTDEKNFLAVCQYHHLCEHGLASKAMKEEYQKRLDNLKQYEDGQ